MDVGLIFFTAFLAIVVTSEGQITYDNDTALGFYWEPAKGNVHHYNVYASTDNELPRLVGTTSTVPTPTNPYHITGEASRVYRLQVEAEDAKGNTGPKSEWSAPVMCTPGDANYDGVVNLTDFILVTRHMLSKNSSADINDDGIVDFDDLDLIGEYWNNTYHNDASDHVNTKVIMPRSKMELQRVEIWAGILNEFIHFHRLPTSRG